MTNVFRFFKNKKSSPQTQSLEEQPNLSVVSEYYLYTVFVATVVFYLLQAMLYAFQSVRGWW